MACMQKEDSLQKDVQDAICLILNQRSSCMYQIFIDKFALSLYMF